MKKIIKNYKSTLILLGSVVIGAICGLIFKEKAEIVKPLGDLFLNLLLVIIVPLIFFTITSSISKMNEKKRLSKILISTIVIFLITSVVAVLFGFLTTAKINLVNPENTEAIKEVFDNTVEEGVDSLIAEVRKMNEELNIPKSFKDAGIDEKEFLAKVDLLADRAFEDQCTTANPRVPLVSEIKQMLLDSYYGK